MKYVFGDFELDIGRQELANGDTVQRLPQRIFDTLYVLIAHRDRTVSKDEIAEKVWHGRAVTDDSVSAAIKEARHQVGDDGTSQRIIRTQHGIGFRWVAEARLKDAGGQAAIWTASQGGAPRESKSQTTGAGRPSIAVLPFSVATTRGRTALLGDAVAAEVITELAKLRWLRVIARGSSFRFRERDPDPQAVANLLNVRYTLAGVIEVRDRGLEVLLELARTSDGTVIWSDRITGPPREINELRSRIVAAIISALEVRIPAEEARVALSRAPEDLDAWGEFHIGLSHLYRYNLGDMARAKAHFEAAIARNSGFARAHAGLSFIAFQQAFMHFSQERERSVAEAADHAERSLSLDPLDPFGNYCMGRASWIAGDLESAKLWSKRSYEISPSYAHGHYLYAMMDLYAGGTETALTESAASLTLSPLDPLSYGMLATHASALIGQDRFEEGATWSELAASRPEAHYLIDMIAAAANEMTGNAKRAEFWATRVRRRRPDASGADFFEFLPVP